MDGSSLNNDDMRLTCKLETGSIHLSQLDVEHDTVKCRLPQVEVWWRRESDASFEEILLKSGWVK